MKRSSVFTSFLSIVLFVVRGIEAQGHSKWPILYPSPSMSSALVLDQSSGKLFHAQGAFEKFYCFIDDPHPPNVDQECSSSLILLSPHHVFTLSFSMVDENGMFIAIDRRPSLQVNGTFFELNTTQMKDQISHEDPTHATVEFTVEVSRNAGPVQVGIAVGDQTRQLMLVHDDRAPQVQSQTENITATHDGHFTAEIRFRDPVYRSVGTRCDALLGSRIPHELAEYSSGNIPIAQQISEVIEASSVCAREICEEVYFQPEDFTILSSNVESNSLRGELDEDRMVLRIKGKLKNPERNINRDANGILDPVPGEKIQIQLLGSRLMDAAGNQLTENIAYSGTAYRLPKGHSPEEDVGDISSKTLLAASAVVAASSLAPSPSYGIGLSGIGPVVEMLTLGQKLYLMGRIGDGRMPENFKSVTEAFAWCALNIKLFWESENSETEETEQDDSDHVELNVLGAKVDATETVEMFRIDKLDPYLALTRVIFFVSVLNTSVLLIRPLLVAVIKLMGRRTPDVLVFPRVELFLAFWTMPAIAAVCTRLLCHSTRGLLLGVLLLVLFPGMFLFCLACILYFTFFKYNPQEWRVQMIAYDTQLQSETAVPEVSLILHNTNSNISETDIEAATGGNLDKTEMEDGELKLSISKPLSEGTKKTFVIHASPGMHSTPIPQTPTKNHSSLIAAFVGRPLEKTKWVTQKEDDKFLQRFGPIFEDYRVPLHSQNLHPSTKSTSKWEGLTLATSIVESFKRIVIAVLCVTDKGVPLALLIAAGIISFCFLIFLRVFRPYRSRWRLGVMLLIELADCVTFTLGVIFVTIGQHDTTLSHRCGLAMLAAQGIAYVLLIGEKLLPSLKKAFHLMRHLTQRDSSSSKP